MSRNLAVTLLIILLMAGFAHAQVNEIKRASSSKNSETIVGGASGNTGSGLVAEFFFQLMFGEVVQAQQQKLQRKQEIPSIVSLEVTFQGATQPSSYYILHPRMRANWGLFSTDFRLNYLLEEDIDGVMFLRTNDWQILQLNLVTTRDITVRIGGGVIYESFGGRNNYPEWTAGVHVRPFGAKLGGVAEYRGAEERTEVNGHIRYAFFEKRRLHGYFTAGAVFQRYYQQVNVWGFQGGVSFSLF